MNLRDRKYFVALAREHDPLSGQLKPALIPTISAVCAVIHASTDT